MSRGGAAGGRGAPRGGPGPGRRDLLAWNVAALVLVLGAWQLASLIADEPGTVPGPVHVLAAIARGITESDLLADLWASLARVLLGFVLAVAVAVPVGFLMGWYRPVRGLIEPLVQFLRTVPPIATIPLVIVFLGIDEQAKVFVIWLAAFLTVVIAAYQGVRQVDPVLVQAARVLGADDRALFFDVIVPASVPYLMVGMRLGLGAAWSTLVAAELVAAQAGLGHRIQEAAQYGRVQEVAAGVVVIGLLGLLMDRSVLLLEHRVGSWQERVER